MFYCEECQNLIEDEEVTDYYDYDNNTIQKHSCGREYHYVYPVKPIRDRGRATITILIGLGIGLFVSIILSIFLCLIFLLYYYQ